MTEKCDHGVKLKDYCIDCLLVENEEFKRLNKRILQTQKMWREATGKESYPDLGELLEWLSEQIMELQALTESQEESNRMFKEQNDHLLQKVQQLESKLKGERHKNANLTTKLKRFRRGDIR